MRNCLYSYVMKYIGQFVHVLGEAYNGMTIQPKLGANYVDT